MYRHKQLPRDSALYQTAQSLAGDLMILPIGMKRLSKYLQGLINGRNYLIGADSGVGKTTVSDFMVFTALMEALKMGIPIKIRYYSWEIARNMKEAKLLSWVIYMTYGIRMPVDYILNRMPQYEPNEEHLLMILEANKVVQNLLKHIEFIEYESTPSEIMEHQVAMAEEVGKIVWHKTSTEGRGKIVGFEKRDPRMIVLNIFDHVALGTQEVGQTTKGMIDAISQTSVFTRNMFGFSNIIIQQFSTDLMSMHRTKGRNSSVLIPQRVDFGDSKYTYRDADIVIGLVRPADFDVVEYHGYDLDKLGRFFIALYLMKNRYGDAGLMCPLFMDYIPGIPLDLPTEVELMFQPIEEFYDLKTTIERCQDSLCLKAG